MGKFEVTMTLIRNGVVEKYAEIAESKKTAKLILAKRYLRKLEREKKLEAVDELKKSHETDHNVMTLSEVLLNAEVSQSKYYREGR